MNFPQRYSSFTARHPTLKTNDYHRFFYVFKRKLRLHGFLFFLFALFGLHRKFNGDDSIRYGFQYPCHRVAFCQGKFKSAAYVLVVLPHQFQRAAQTWRRNLDAIMFAQQALFINMVFEIAADALAFFDRHAGVAVNEDLQLVALVKI